jgi:DNA-directed RNA polymerase subunit RPC12/RpoP
MYNKNENDELTQNENKDVTCPFCGLRQYSDTCARCGIPIKEEDEKEKTKDDDDEYEWREKR